MFRKVGYKTVGLELNDLDSFKEKIESSNVRVHTLQIAKGNGIFLTLYTNKYNEKSIHRMYSSTKSLTSLAIGCLYDDKLIKLDDKISSFFNEFINENTDKTLLNQTIEDTLKMGTCITCQNWFDSDIKDRVKLYFNQVSNRNLNEYFEYDSAGSLVLGAIVEKVTGKNMYDYVYSKILSKLDGFKKAYMLKTPTGYAWADSGLMASTSSMLELASLLLNEGIYNNQRLLSKEYIKKATSKYLDTNNQYMKCKQYGYGYQIWMVKDGYAFFGMGNQITIIYPKFDCIFTMTGNCFDNRDGRDLIVDEVYKLVSKTKEIKNVKSTYYRKKISLFINDSVNKKEIEKINHKTFINENNKVIDSIRFESKRNILKLIINNKKVFKFVSNKTTKTKLVDKYSKNRKTFLPEYDTYNLYMGIESIKNNKIALQGQILGTYFANIKMDIVINVNSIDVTLKTYAENFLKEYNINDSYKLKEMD